MTKAVLKRILALITAMLVVSAIATTVVYYGNIVTIRNPTKDSSPMPVVTNESNASFYELAYAKATSEQKEELDKIIADKSIGLPGEWRRAVLITIGDLPKDTPRLSAEQAAKLYDSKDVSALESEFNKIAGAPDFVGGSGIERSIYFLNDDRSEAIYLMLGDAFHIVFNDDGTETTLPLGKQKLPVDPGPSKAPLGTPQTLPIEPSPTKAP